MRSIHTILPLGAALVCLIGACSTGSGIGGTPESVGATSDGDQIVLNVYAAASLTETFTKLEGIFESDRPGVDVRFNLAGSQDLVAQIAQGAPADVLATANESTMDVAREQGLVTESTLFATNTLTIITTPGNPAGVTGLDSSLDSVALVICAPEVPCGKLTAKLTESLGITLNPVSEEQAVTDVRGKVSSGQADAGIVYKTDAVAEGDAVDTVEIEGADNAVNAYPIAPVSTTQHAEAAQAWIDLVLSERGQVILEEAGFTPAK